MTNPLSQGIREVDPGLPVKVMPNEEQAIHTSFNALFISRSG